jgi:NAD(P)-dependent dehydrogenase (short-subunit alcohol dehydrogenase family)
MDAQFSLADRVAVVTGASRGLGRSISLGMARAGAHIVGVGRTEEDLSAVIGEVKTIGREALAIPADITKLSEIDSVVEKALAAFGRIDILVNNAGINIPQNASEVTEEAWDQVMNINLKATFFCSQRVGMVMIDQRHGKIINISSQMALVGYYKRSAYCASKGGVAQITKVLAVEWAPFNINVNSVAPTFVETAMTANMFSDRAFREDVMSRIPMGRLAQPEDVVGAVVYLASPASDFVTGHTLLVDGGWVAW